MSEAPLLLRPERVLCEDGLLENREIVVVGDRITEIRETTQAPNLANRILLPGFVNAHSHAFQRAMRGRTQWGSQDDFWTWRDRMYHVAGALDPDGVEAISALVFLEMALAGYTTVGEFHYLHHQPNGRPYADPQEMSRRVISAARRVGLRICLLRVVYGRAGVGQPPDPRQFRFYDPSPKMALRAMESLRSEDPAVSVGLAPHSVRAVPRSWLYQLSECKEPIHVHVDEQPAEVEQCLSEHGCRPLQLLADAGLVHDRFCAVHFTWSDAAEIEILRQAGGRVCACPSTEMDLGDGFLPIEDLVGIPVCIGSDSQVRIDPLAEIRDLEWSARARLQRRNIVEASDKVDALATSLLRAGTLHGADALGLETGAISVGRLADFVTVDARDPALAGVPLLPGLVFSGHNRMIREAWVGGQAILEQGTHPLAESIVREAESAMQSLD